ncbi:hypothetical protein ABPG74_001639 [Tetrahymena malaccensis]
MNPLINSYFYLFTPKLFSVYKNLKPFLQILLNTQNISEQLHQNKFKTAKQIKIETKKTQLELLMELFIRFIFLNIKSQTNKLISPIDIEASEIKFFLLLGQTY